jgi:hypothetical protein
MKTMSAPKWLFDAGNVFERGLAPLLRIGARAEPFGDGGTDADLDRRRVAVQGLGVGVDRAELDAFEPEAHHGVHSVSARAAAADHLDACLVFLGLVGKLDRETHGGASRIRKKSCCRLEELAEGASSLFWGKSVKLAWSVLLFLVRALFFSIR